MGCAGLSGIGASTSYLSHQHPPRPLSPTDAPAPERGRCTTSTIETKIRRCHSFIAAGAKRMGALSPSMRQCVLDSCHFSRSISVPSFFCSLSTGPFQGRLVCLVFSQSVLCRGSSFGFSLLICTLLSGSNPPDRQPFQTTPSGGPRSWLWRNRARPTALFVPWGA